MLASMSIPWLDDMAGLYESSQTEFQGGDVQRVLISLLKILCQHYGKLRSSFGSDPSQETSANMKGYGAVVRCMRNLPLESQIQAWIHCCMRYSHVWSVSVVQIIRNRESVGA